MFDVFRFAWFAVRTFFGILLLVLVLRGALWTLVKLHSAAMAHAKPAAATYRVPASSASITTPQRENSGRTCVHRQAGPCSSLPTSANLPAEAKTESIDLCRSSRFDRVRCEHGLAPQCTQAQWR